MKTITHLLMLCVLIVTKSWLAVVGGVMLI
jgi:hypothetical protein